MRALSSTFDATPTIGGPLFIRLLLQPPPKLLLADSKSTGADSGTFHRSVIRYSPCAARGFVTVFLRVQVERGLNLGVTQDSLYRLGFDLRLVHQPIA
jgi:hypothetical protein